MKLSSISTIASLLAFTSASEVVAPTTQIVTAPTTFTTGSGSVTSYGYSGSRTSVWVYPTAGSNKDATVSVYVNNVVVEVIVINININIINGAPTTVYSTKGDKPTYTPPPPSTTATVPATSTHTPTIHTVIVGIDGNLAYGANQVDAAIGDIIRFDFNSTNHTVTQSDFNTPCSPKAGGFNTGFNQFNPTNHVGVIFRDFIVDVSTPLWFYCAQTVKVSHCQKGMVLGVNPAGKFPAFLSLATATETITTVVGKPTSTSSVLHTTTSTAKTSGSGVNYRERRARREWTA
jgi:hypothetical protein